MIDVTPDGLPVISAVDAVPGFFIATGFTGHGFGIGPGAGRLMAELVTGETPWSIRRLSATAGLPTGRGPDRRPWRRASEASGVCVASDVTRRLDDTNNAVIASVRGDHRQGNTAMANSLPTTVPTVRLRRLQVSQVMRDLLQEHTVP